MVTSSQPLETRFSPLTHIARQRLLPTPGEILVKVGDRVRAEDIVAQATVPGQLLSIDATQELSVGVASVPRYMQVGEGEIVAAGDTLASVRRLGMRTRVLKAPCTGTVQGVADGRIFFLEEPRTLQLRASVPGEVIEEHPQHGVTISTYGCLVRGVWGTGGENQGLLAIMVGQAGEALVWEKIDPRYRDTILVGGFVDDPTVLSRAQQFRIRGLILGSLLPSLRPFCESLSLPIVITEGMGRMPMAEPVYNCLRSLHGELAIISGANHQGQSEVIIPRSENIEETTSAVAPLSR
ncbi:MAG: hypothetical protein A2Y73_09100 [Chloroflexi bacterium RBG_13_56_8]|nr:MAG: hypothetical protein A2Y73_09100 [Chloroflexi bacterium RBG_13_56_8]